MANYQCKYCNRIVPIREECSCGEHGRELAKMLNLTPIKGSPFDTLRGESSELKIANLKDEVKKLTEERNYWKAKYLTTEQQGVSDE